ncbi:TolC family protein [Siphonobacter curvatus]|uniref:Transporter n=1 Tax=Siphonobacter curvatus TaxID=2094562 RepID=A0A2S7IMW8_9BACT|nr:TolC family protein [Siphonobacter curvatus]PQA59035.1 transporter [Siphonobacter curvatus]
MSNIKRILLLQVILGLSLIQTLCGQPPRLSLDEVLDKARTNYPSIRGKLAAIRSSEADAQSTRLSFLPQAGVQAQAFNATSNQVRGASASAGGLMIPITGVRTDGFNNQAAWTSAASMVIDWEAVTFGRRQARRNQANLSIEQAKADYESELFLHQVRVCDAYLLALNLKKSVLLQISNLQRAKALQIITRASTSGGLRPGIDSSVSAAEVARARLQVLESQKMAQQQVLRLTELMGEPSLGYELDSLIFYHRLPDMNRVSGEKAYIHPQLRVLQKQMALGEANQTLLKANALPSISVIGSLQGRGSGISEAAQDGTFRIDPTLGAGLPLRAFNYIVGFTAIWRPTELFRVKPNLSAQRERVRVSQESYNQQKLALDAGSENANLQIELAQATVRQAPLQLEAAQQAYAQSRARYESGLDNIQTLTQTAALLNRAEVDQALAVNGLWRALLLKAAADGNLEEFLNQILN